MKKMKRLFAVMLCAALALMLAVPAFADDVDESSDTGSSSGYTITIENAVEGVKYKAYKLFDVTTSTTTTTDEGTETTTNHYAYTISRTSAWYNTISDYATDVTTAHGLTLTASASDSSIYVVTFDDGEFSAADFASYLNEHIPEGEDGNSGTYYGDGSYVITVDDPGYYFVDSSLGSLCMLNTLSDSVTIYEKNSDPSITKEVLEDSTGEYADSATIDIIDTVSYRLTVNTGNNDYAPDTTTDTGIDANYVITDTLPAGFSFVTDSNNESLEITITNQEKDENNDDVTVTWERDKDYTITVSNQTATITLLSTGKLGELNQNTNIIITYDATVTTSNMAKIGGDGNENTAVLKYNDYTTQDSATVYTYEIGGNGGDGDGPFKKVDENGKPLKGVEFVLQQDSASGDYAVVDSDGYLTGWNSDQAYASTITTDESGLISIKGLDAGTYILTETKTLDGYNLLSDTITVTIAEDGKITYKLTNDTSEDGSTDSETITVVNNSGTELPSTGGMGTTIFYVVGGVLVVGAGVLLVTKRRMKGRE